MARHGGFHHNYRTYGPLQREAILVIVESAALLSSNGGVVSGPGGYRAKRPLTFGSGVSLRRAIAMPFDCGSHSIEKGHIG